VRRSGHNKLGWLDECCVKYISAHKNGGEKAAYHIVHFRRLLHVPTDHKINSDQTTVLGPDDSAGMDCIRDL